MLRQANLVDVRVPREVNVLTLRVDLRQ